PLAEAIVTYAELKGCQMTQPDHLTAIEGAGIKVEIGTRQVMVGNLNLLDQNDIDVSAAIQVYNKLSQAGKTVLYVAVDNVCVGLFAIADKLRAEAPEAVTQLADSGHHLVMLTGDHPDTARVIAEQAGIDNVVSQVMPDEKQDRIKELQDSGKVVAMVGDGINDAPALAQADVGIAMGSGTDIAIESGDIVIVTGKLNKVLTALNLSRAVMKNIRQNLFWAFIYNISGIPIAAGLLVIFGGPGLNPMLAGAAMAASSVSVVSNALRLRLFND
ncbi:MAG: HAD-IC family P-type ATPase, partial [Desulfobulbia bacterium]